MAFAVSSALNVCAVAFFVWAAVVAVRELWSPGAFVVVLPIALVMLMVPFASWLAMGNFVTRAVSRNAVFPEATFGDAAKNVGCLGITAFIHWGLSEGALS